MYGRRFVISVIFKILSRTSCDIGLIYLPSALSAVMMGLGCGDGQVTQFYICTGFGPITILSSCAPLHPSLAPQLDLLATSQTPYIYVLHGLFTCASASI